QQFAIFRKNRNAFVRIASIVKKYSGQLTVRAPLTDMDGHAVFDRRKTPRLNDAAHDVGANFGQPIAQHAKAFWSELGADRADEQRHHESGSREPPEQNPRRHACSVHAADFYTDGTFV